MKCRDCRHGRAFASGSVNCILYGMILRAEHECTLEREIWIHDDSESGSEGKTEIRNDGGGDAGEVPGVLSESGERGGIPGMEMSAIEEEREDENQKTEEITLWEEEDSGSYWPRS